MIELGKVQVLKIVTETDFGVYLGSEEEKVLLPKKQVPEGYQIGDEVEVFIYRDSSDRLISTTRIPMFTLGETAVLEATQVTTIGAFLNWGLEKDLLLPYKEQTINVKEGQSYVVALYIDKSSRLCATMKVYPYLRSDSEYKKDDKVNGIVYEIKDGFGAFVAVDGIYHALIPSKDIHTKLSIGSKVEARVTAVREDGKLDLSLREKAYMQMDADAELILKVMEDYNGVLPYTDKASPEVIARDFSFSKNAFKRAIGRLLKENKIEITNDSIQLK